MNEQGRRTTLETINAAATAIASAQNRVPPTSFQKRRWGSGWSIYWCFGAKKQNKRIGHAVFVTETTANGTDRPVADNSTQPPPIVLPFVAPPSSPASFLQSEPPSATQSPGGAISFSSISKNIYSPGEPNLIFAIGPYAHETQLVSPPAFSTYNTEPSTAPFTPPPESLHLTTPSSPEVPFAKLLDPYHQDIDASHRYPFSQYAFQSYQLQPGSPVSNLISPGSAFSRSGTSSPFLDHEIATGCPQFLEFNKSVVPPKLLSLDKIAPQEWGLRQGSGTLTPDAVGPRSHGSFLLGRQNSDIAPLSNSYDGFKNCLAVIDYRVSFEIAAEEVARCVEKKPTMLSKVGSMSPKDVEYNANREQNQAESSIGREPSNEICEACSVNDEGGQWHQKHRSITLGSAKEFNFNMDGGDTDKPMIGNWWENERGPGKEDGQSKNWTFFPMLQPGIS